MTGADEVAQYGSASQLKLTENSMDKQFMSQSKDCKSLASIYSLKKLKEPAQVKRYQAQLKNDTIPGLKEQPSARSQKVLPELILKQRQSNRLSNATEVSKESKINRHLEIMETQPSEHEIAKYI